MNKRQFTDWMLTTGYSDMNDWNYQEIGSEVFYWIKNYDTNLYALVKQSNKLLTYTVLVQDYNDFGVFNDSTN